MRYTASLMLQEHGWRSFFRGLSPALIRAVPTNAVTFLMYETSSRHLQAVMEDQFW